MKYNFAKVAFIVLFIFSYTFIYPNFVNAGLFYIDSMALSNNHYSTNADSVYTNLTINTILEENWTIGEKIKITFVEFDALQHDQFDLGAITTSEVALTCDPEGTPTTITDSVVVVNDGDGTASDYLTITTGGVNNCADASLLRIEITGELIRTPYTGGDYSIQVNTLEGDDTPIDTDSFSVFISGAITTMSAVFNDWDAVAGECNHVNNAANTAVCASTITFTPVQWVGSNSCAVHGVKIYFGPDFDLSGISQSDITINLPGNTIDPFSQNINTFFVDDGANGCADAICLGFGTASRRILGGNEVVIGINNLDIPDETKLTLPLTAGNYPIAIETRDWYCEGADFFLPGNSTLLDDGNFGVNIALGSLTGGVDITAEVDPVLSMTVSPNTCEFGTIPTSDIKTCSYILSVTTNGRDGYYAAIRQNHNLRAQGDDEIPGILGIGYVTAGVPSYGIATSDPDFDGYGYYIPADPDPDDCESYNNQHDKDAPALELSTFDSSIAYANSTVVDDQTVICHAVAVDALTPAGVYSHQVILTVSAYF